VGVALTAPELLTLALGDRWSGAILPLQILAWVVPFRSIIFVVPQVLLMMGESRAMMWNAVRTLCVLAPSFLVGAYWGVVGVAAVWVVVYPFCMLPLLRRMMRKIQMPAREYFGAIRTPLIAVGIMATSVYAVELAIPTAGPLWFRAAAKVSAGLVTYGLALWRIYPPKRTALWKELIVGMRAAPEK
jgi:O-antigen/teichoic acid export membrane protein